MHKSLTLLITGSRNALCQREAVTRCAGVSSGCVRRLTSAAHWSTRTLPYSMCGVAAVLRVSTASYATPRSEEARTGTSSTSSASSSQTPNEEPEPEQSESVNPVVRACKWRSEAFVERMGFAVGQPFTEDQLRAHFKVLAKHYHPDSAGDTPDATAAFQNIKEAYDALLQQVKAQGGQFRGTERDPGFHYSDEARRRSQMKALGDGVMLFMFFTLVFIVVVARYSKERLNSRYLTSLLAIFFTIQLFPRLLAAAILYACHVSYVIQNTELREQAAVSVFVSRTKEAVDFSLQGIDPTCAPDVIVQAEVSVDPAASESAGVVYSTTLTFDKGATRVVVPVPSDKTWCVHLKAHDEHRRQIVMDKSVCSDALPHGI